GFGRRLSAPVGRWAGRTLPEGGAAVNGTGGPGGLGRPAPTDGATPARAAARAERGEARFTKRAPGRGASRAPSGCGLVEAPLGRLEPLGVERLHRLGRPRHDRRDVLVRLEVGEDVIGEVASVAAPGAADADPEAEEVPGAEVLRDRAQPVVPGEAAAAACLEPARLEVGVVVDDEDRVRLEPVEAGGGADRAARLVHERLRLEQADPVVVDPHEGEPARELLAPGAAVAPGELVDDHVADVVAVARVLAARVAEPGDEQVERRGALASPPRRPHLLPGGLCGLAALRRRRPGLGGRLGPRLLGPRLLHPGRGG